MPFRFSNNSSTTLAASLTSGATSLTVASGTGALFPSLSAGQFFNAVLMDSSNNLEIVRVSARAGDTFTIARAQEGTVARAYSSGDRVELRMTSAGLENFVQLDGDQTITGIKTFSNGLVGNVTGNLTGNVTGNVTGNLSGNVTGNLTGSVTGNVSGNAGTVTNGVYTNTDQTITGIKIFSSVSNRIGGFAIGTGEAYLYESSAHAFAVRTGSSGTGYKYFGLSAAGDMTVQGAVIASGDITAYSDESLKENWRQLPTDFVERLAQVKSGIYDRKDTGETQVGVGAQSLLPLMPNAVHESGGIMSVAYGNAAMAACVELAKQIVAIKAEMAQQG